MAVSPSSAPPMYGFPYSVAGAAVAPSSASPRWGCPDVADAARTPLDLEERSPPVPSLTPMEERERGARDGENRWAAAVLLWAAGKEDVLPLSTCAYMHPTDLCAHLAEVFYKAPKQRFDDDAKFKDRAQQAVVRLQGGEEKYHAAWKKICEIRRNEFDQVYKLLDVHLEGKG